MESKEEIQKRINEIIEEVKKKTAFRDHYMEEEKKLSKEIEELINEVKKLNENLKDMR